MILPMQPGGGITIEDLRKNTAIAKQYSTEGDRYAFVFSTDLDFGMGRMLAAYAEMEKYVSDIGIFRSVSDAMKWLADNS